MVERLAIVETKIDVVETKVDTIAKKLDNFIECADNKYAERARVQTLEGQVDQLRLGWAKATGILAVLLIVMEILTKYLF
jgi:tetrahydromethanopterin S-methyltransferase subunit B